ncbi:hypothetical protein HID58_030518 [Brassica napus]|uniref:Uncharacterized protein n=1 Tax=Brassica napus TaxID=3708 RepID=A0ABQ8CH03_BRANA|nr:hypothetical protein HID58_030518 [Brassica napus]
MLETVEHVLMHCPFAQRTWELAPIFLPSSQAQAFPLGSLQQLFNVEKIVTEVPTCSVDGAWNAETKCADPFGDPRRGVTQLCQISSNSGGSSHPEGDAGSIKRGVFKALDSIGLNRPHFCPAIRVSVERDSGTSMRY